MIRFLAIQHTHSEFLGTFETQFEARGIAYVYQRPLTGQDLAGSALQFDALWLLGGAWPVDDREHCPWLPDELRLIQVFRNARRPVVGFGFGAQLIARAFGGAVRAEPSHDCRWTTARLTEAGRHDPLARALDGERVLVIANGRVELPAALPPLLVDEQGGWLAIRPSPLAYGLLFRPELKPGMIEDMIMEEGRALADDVGEVLAEARERWPQMQRVADRSARALVEALDLMQERHKAPVFTLHAVRGGQ